MVDLDLVEPAGVDGQVDEDQVAPAALEPVDRALAAVVGAVVDDPEDAPRGGVGLLVITCPTSRSNGSIPPLGSLRPNTLPRRTSQASR